MTPVDIIIDVDFGEGSPGKCLPIFEKRPCIYQWLITTLPPNVSVFWLPLPNIFDNSTLVGIMINQRASCHR